MLQLIFDDLTFNNEGFKTYFKDNNYHPENKEYHTLAIIGCQSSGKSTLLNHVFGTNFEVMDEDKGRGQTTKGIWIAINKETNTVLFDVEGTDAKERGDNRFKFEQCSSLFALAMADVLMINMWTSDIGRYTASNYGVLKVVFEMNLKLFQQESEKKIIVVLRDFDENNDNKDRLKEGIFGDLRQIWNEIKKPEKYAGCSPEKFFKFEFLTLPHKFYFPDDFNKGVQDIKNKFIKPKEGQPKDDFLYNHVKYDKNVPIDGLFKYTWDMWSNIINNKDLNIPGQKEMLAEFRCNEIKDAALSEVDQAINDLESESAINKIEDFKPRVKGIVDKALGLYDQTAKEYIPHIYQNIRKQLDQTLDERLKPSFYNQTKKLIPSYQKKFRSALERETRKNDHFCSCAQNVKKDFMKQLKDEVQELQAYDTWEIGEDTEALFDEIIEHQRQLSLEDKKEEAVKKIKNILDESLENRMETISPEFWEEINQDNFTNLRSINTSYKAFLEDYYQITPEEFKNFSVGCEDMVYDSLKKDFMRYSRDIIGYCTENFKKNFWYDEGIPRQWNKLNDKTIDELFEKYKAPNLQLFELFKKFRVIKNPLNLLEYKQVDEEEFNKIINDDVPKIISDPNTEFENFLSSDEISSMKLKYGDEVNEIYEEAKRNQHNIKQVSIPLWAWAILIYVSYDDILKMLTSYWIIPVILLASAYGVLNLLGLGGMPKMVYNMIMSQIQGKSKKD
ncbi:MAG: 50S ribosome-binding GTPase [archaeon]|nr:50S ribosome-binding GTPase [archaeon]